MSQFLLLDDFSVSYANGGYADIEIMSKDEALAFIKKISKKLGINLTVGTENIDALEFAKKELGGGDVVIDLDYRNPLTLSARDFAVVCKVSGDSAKWFKVEIY